MAFFEFEPLSADDIERLHGWFNAPHVRPWFGGGRTLESVTAEYLECIQGLFPMRAYIVRHARKPIGMLEWARFGDFPVAQRLYEIDDPNVVNCDILIGEPDALHRGWAY